MRKATFANRTDSSKDEIKQKRKFGIAGICIWGLLLGIVIARSYFIRSEMPKILH